MTFISSLWLRLPISVLNKSDKSTHFCIFPNLRKSPIFFHAVRYQAWNYYTWPLICWTLLLLYLIWSFIFFYHGDMLVIKYFFFNCETNIQYLCFILSHILCITFLFSCVWNITGNVYHLVMVNDILICQKIYGLLIFHRGVVHACSSMLLGHSFLLLLCYSLICYQDNTNLIWWIWRILSFSIFFLVGLKILTLLLYCLVECFSEVIWS